MPSPRANIPPPTVQDCSSAGRASVSKTECRGFESLHSCQNLHVHAYKRNGRWTFLERGHSRSGWKTGCGFWRSEEHTSELQSLMRISYAVFCLKKNKESLQPETCLTDSSTSNTEIT